MRLVPTLLILLGACATLPPAPSTPERAEVWWGHVETLAADEMEGRLAGSEGYLRAAAYVAERFAEYGLEPAGSEGFFQPVPLEERSLILAQSRAALVADGTEAPLRMPQDLLVRVSGPLPERVEAPLVFIGYGLHLPDAGHDDLAGLDLAGKVAVVIGGGPQELPGVLKSHARAERARQLRERGAVGLISLGSLGQAEQPWSRFAALAEQPGKYIVEPGPAPPPFFQASMNPAEAERLFAGSGHGFARISALADASAPVPVFALRPVFRADFASRSRRLSAPNVVARLPGSDPALAGEHVVLTAHLDGLGVRAPGAGDRINNGALDNAAGVAALLDIAEQYQRRRVRPRRSILFVALTAEESGLLGARYFSRHPTVPRESLVANLNYDMALPLFPLRSVIALGADQSSLGRDAEAVGATMGLPLTPDPFPDRNSFIRSDQYAFIEQGIPALAFKFGFAANTPEAEIERLWRATRYHGVSDDSAQQVFREDEIRLHDFIAAIALRVADADDRPRWNPDSVFRRFARP